jgi:hypothetical protein
MHPIDDQPLSALDPAAIVGKLKARQEVLDALYRFGLGLDLQDRRLLSSALAADAELDARPAASKWGAYLPVMVGRDTIVNLLLAMFAGRVDATHMVADPRVQMDGDTARLTAMVQTQHLLRAEHSRHAMLNNRYAVDLVRDGARWVMHRMHVDTVWYTGDPTAILRRSVEEA